MLSVVGSYQFPDEAISIEEHINRGVSSDKYCVVSLVTFASMSVQVMSDLKQDYLVMGSLKQM